MAEVRLGVIGLGFMGGRWARALAEHAGARLAVVADVREDVAREVAERYGAAAVVDPLEAATSPDLDGVAVCTPEHLHTTAALAAIDAGKAVMVEKPLAHTVADAEQIRDRAAERGVPVLTGHTLRFEPRYAAVRRAIEAGEVGAVQAVRSERIGLVSDQRILSGRTSIALYYGVHEFDLCRWYAGDVEAIWAARSTGILEQRGYPVEDLYSVGLRFASGAHGTSMVGWCLPAGTPGYGIGGFTVIGEHGLLRVAQGEVGLLKVGEDGRADDDVYYSPEVNGRLYGAVGIEADHFVRVTRGEVEPACTAADGAAAVRIALAMEEAARLGAGGAAVSESRYAVRAAVRVLDILDLLQQSADAVTLADVADATGLPKSSAFRYLATMESRGYVQRDTAGYHLGIGFLLVSCRTSGGPRRSRPAGAGGGARSLRGDRQPRRARRDARRLRRDRREPAGDALRGPSWRPRAAPLHGLGQGDRLDLGLRPRAGHPRCRRNAATHASHHHRPRAVRAGRDDGGPRRLRGRRPGERGGRPLCGGSAGRGARSRRGLAGRPRQPSHR